MPGDGGELGEQEADVYRRVSAENAERLATVVRAGDVVLLHDPQTAGLVARLKKRGAKVVWRSHVGAEVPNERVRRAWEFVSPHLPQADARVFSRRAYIPPWLEEEALSEVIQPSIDVFSPKNQEMSEDVVRAILGHIGVVSAQGAEAVPTFLKADGSPGRVDRRCSVVSEGPPGIGVPLVVQISRWDRLKDPEGVMRGFVDHVAPQDADAQLVLGGPAVTGVADDPEGAEIFAQVERSWSELPAAERRRVHLVSFPMEDIDENAAMVNAVQRHATVVVQKSLEEGFGLTVAEAMWKSRPVVACAVGGIPDQIEDGVTGLLLEDPADLERFAERTLELLRDAGAREAIGRNAHEHVRGHFLVNRHALQYIGLFVRLLAGDAVPGARGAQRLLG
jgi:trehalose synthase